MNNIVRQGLPYIDPNVEHVGVSRLRRLNATRLRQHQKVTVVQDNDEPIAVLVAYKKYLEVQGMLEALLRTVELLSDESERQLLVDGLRDVSEGRTKSIEEVRASLFDGT